MKDPIHNFLSGLIFLGLITSCETGTGTTASDLELEVDQIIQPYIDSARAAGVVVAVVKGDSLDFRKAYGFADLEFEVPMPIEASFEIGSVTKQFTAVAILQLVNGGKLSLEDDITRYLDFDTQGRKVTIRRLLDHTSGIKSYTEIPEFWPMSLHTYPRDTLLRLVENSGGFDFEPGEALIYNNTAYFMLGLIIEKASGQSYEDYIKNEVFTRAGMTNSYYCSQNKLVRNRAHGYEMREDGMVRKGYLDHTWPFAAGSLCSTAGDLVKWNKALHKGKILNDEMYELLITPEKLNDGTQVRYAKGLSNFYDKGRHTIEHGGGINGFLSSSVYYPDEDLIIIVLINTSGPVSPNSISDRIAERLIPADPASTVDFNDSFERYTGKYSGRGRGRDLSFEINHTSENLTVKAGPEGEESIDTLSYLGNNTWAQNNQLFIFKGEDDKPFQELRVDGVSSHYILQRTNKPGS